MMKYVKSLHYATCYEICLYTIKENDLFAQNMMSFLHLQKYKTSPRFPRFVELLKIFDSIKNPLIQSWLVYFLFKPST